MTRKTKFALIGLDSAIPSFVRKYFDRGLLPNMQALAEEGTFSEILPVFPSHTAANWNTIATGAWPNTHGVTDMAIHLPGTPLTDVVSGFYSDLCRAEQLWKTAERSGRIPILMKYIASWPPSIKKGIQVEGFGAPGGPGARPWGSSPLALSNSSCFSTKQLQNATQVRFTEPILLSSSSGHGDPAADSQPIATEIRIAPHLGGGIPYTVTLQSASSGAYDSALIFKTGSDKKDSMLLKKGEVSKWLVEEFAVKGESVKAAFRMKLVDVGNAADVDSAQISDKQFQDTALRFRLFVSQIFPLEGWTYPDRVARELVDKCGPFLESISHFPYAFGWTDEGTFLDDLEYQAKWMTDATDYLMSNYPWDLYMTQWHGIDNAQHAFLRFDKSVLTPQEKEISERVVRRSYEIADYFVGHIAASSGISTGNRVVGKSNGNNHQDEDIYAFVISDHGHVMGKRRFFVNQFLYEQGLIKLKRDRTTGKASVDWGRTQAFAQGMVSIYVNLKGRDPEGCVEPGKEYEDLVERLIEMLYDIKDPLSGRRPYRLVLSNSDSEFLGLSGERTGDVITAVNPVYVPDNRMRFGGDLFENLKTGLPDGSVHGQQLPSVDMGDFGSIRSVLIAYGPTIRKGHIMKKPVKMVDIAPTVSHILGIPAPRHSEGRVLHELFAD